uniref:Uncharacterized protein n=1 Tax=Caenorhabditis tropicalis TaxID=1561998 RepID=A0A1I7TLB8_9PELO
MLVVFIFLLLAVPGHGFSNAGYVIKKVPVFDIDNFNEMTWWEKQQAFIETLRGLYEESEPEYLKNNREIVRAPFENDDESLVEEYLHEKQFDKTGKFPQLSIEERLINDILGVMFGHIEYIDFLNNPEQSEMVELIKEMIYFRNQPVLRKQLLHKILAGRAWYEKFVNPMLEDNKRQKLLEFGQHLLEANENGTLSSADTAEFNKHLQSIAIFDRPQDKEFRGMMNQLLHVFGSPMNTYELSSTPSSQDSSDNEEIKNHRSGPIESKIYSSSPMGTPFSVQPTTTEYRTAASTIPQSTPSRTTSATTTTTAPNGTAVYGTLDPEHASHQSSSQNNSTVPSVSEEKDFVHHQPDQLKDQLELSYTDIVERTTTAWMEETEVTADNDVTDWADYTTNSDVDDFGNETDVKDDTTTVFPDITTTTETISTETSYTEVSEDPTENNYETTMDISTTFHHPTYVTASLTSSSNEKQLESATEKEHNHLEKLDPSYISRTHLPHSTVVTTTPIANRTELVTEEPGVYIEGTEDAKDENEKVIDKNVDSHQVVDGTEKKRGIEQGNNDEDATKGSKAVVSPKISPPPKSL